MGRKGRNDAVAARFQQEGADRECLFVVVYAENRLLGPQCSLASAGGRRPIGQACGPAGLPLHEPRCSGIPPLVRPETNSGGNGLSAPERSRPKRQSSPVRSHGEQCHCPANEAGPRGKREARAGAGCLARAQRDAGDRPAASAVGVEARKKAARHSTAFAGSDGALRESRLCGSRASLNLGCQ